MRRASQSTVWNQAELKSPISIPGRLQAEDVGAATIPNVSGAQSQLFAATAKIAGRLNAAHVSDEEYQSLLKERQSLLDRKFGGTLTKSESRRLEYVRWSLDRIDDSRYGANFEALDKAISAYEQFRDELRGLQSELSKHAGRKR